MSARYLMGLDVGGGGGCCLIVNTTTGETCSASRTWSLTPDRTAGGFAYRMDPNDLWQTLCEMAREALRRAGVQPGEVAGIAAASMCYTSVVLDRDGSVLLMAPNRDARAAAQALQLAAEHGDALYHSTGRSLSDPIRWAMATMSLQAFRS